MENAKMKAQVKVMVVDDKRFGPHKEIKFSDGKIMKVGVKNKQYDIIPDNFSGEAEVDFGEYKGKIYIASFKVLSEQPSAPDSEPVRPQANLKSEYKADPAKIANEKFIALCEMFCKCLYNAVEAAKAECVEKNSMSIRIAATDWFIFGVQKITEAIEGKAIENKPEPKKEEVTENVPF